jgi:hypothetical protein
MAKQITFYNLREDVKEEDFVKWVHEFKGPFISGLSSVRNYTVSKTKIALKSEEGSPEPVNPPYRIVGIVDVTRLKDYERDQQIKVYKEDFMPQFSKWIQDILILQVEEFYHSEADYSEHRIV